MNPKYIIWVLIFLFLISCAIAEKPSDITLNQFVIDNANVLTPEQEQEIEGILKPLYDNGTLEYAVVTINSLEGMAVEDFAYELAEGVLGDKEKNNGLLLLISKGDREYRIEVGRGIEPILNDAKVGRIARNYLVPSLKEDDYYSGIMLASVEITKVFNNDPVYENVDEENFEEKYLIYFILGILILYILMVLLNLDSGSSGGSSGGKVIIRQRSSGGSKGGFRGFGGGSFGGGGAGGRF